MSKQTRNTQLFYKSLLLLFVVMLLIGLWNLPSVQASDDAKTTGIVQSMPSSGLIGDWVIGGTTYRTTASSEIEESNGPFAVGACVEVEYATDSTPFGVNKLATQDASKCDGNASATPDSTGTPDASPTPSITTTTRPDSTGTPDAEREVKGIVSVMPSPSLIGTWVIDGVEYIANSSTEFEQDDGPFVVGACVEVKFLASTTPYVAHEIKTEKQSDCSVDGTPTPSPTGTPGDERAVYGHIDSFPADLVGDWVVGGVTYRATTSTEFEPEYGPFAVGVCVKVHVQTTATPGTISEIETEQAYHCGSDGTATPEAELFGVLQSFPTDLVGNWNIGGMTFVADTNTEFEQENGAFAVDMTVKVHFIVQNGVNYALEIETKYANDSDGSDDDGDGLLEGAEGHAFSEIDSFPAELIGQWVIGGIEYMANDKTVFEQDDGSFAVDAKVKVEYYLDATKNRVAQKFETTSDDGGVSSPDHFKLFGFVHQMPPNGFAGSWVVDNIAFVADANSQFKEDNGVLGLGAFVAVEYLISDDGNLIHEVETHVPPGAGSHQAIGDIQSIGNVTAAGVSSVATWVIGGKSYIVNPATDLNEVSGALTIGATALVNSYTATDGSEAATQIRGIVLNEKMLLPVVAR